MIGWTAWQRWPLHQDQTHSSHRDGPVPLWPIVVQLWGWLPPWHPPLTSFPMLLREGCSLWEEGRRESTLSSWFCLQPWFGKCSEVEVSWKGLHYLLSWWPPSHLFQLLPSFGGTVFCLPAGTVLGQAFNHTEHPYSDLLWILPMLMKMGSCTEQQRLRGQRNSETFLESSEALQVWIYWEDNKKTATCPCTTSHHPIVMTLFPSSQVMARSSLVPLADAASGCVDPSHNAARKTNLRDLFWSSQPLCLMNKKAVWCLVSPPLVHARIADSSFTKHASYKTGCLDLFCAGLFLQFALWAPG